MKEGKEQNPQESPFFWVRFFKVVTVEGKPAFNPNPVLEKRVRFLSDLMDAALEIQASGDFTLSAFWDSQNREIPDQQAITEELARRQQEFAKTAKPEDWQHRKMALEMEEIWDKTYLPSPTLKHLTGPGQFIAQTTPQDMARREKSGVLKILLERVEQILSTTQTTSSFEKFICQRIKTAYQFGVPVKGIVPLSGIGLDLDHNQYDLFDPSKTENIERWAYKADAATFLPELRKKEAEELSLWREEFKKRYGKEL